MPEGPRSQHRRLSVRLSLLVVAALVAVLAGACGDDDDSGSTATGGEPVAASGSFPVSVEHELGTTVIEAEPERIVIVGLTEQDTVLALGLTPVAVTEWYGEQPFATWPWAQDELGDAEPEVLSESDGPQYERINALDPDIIIGTNAGIDEQSYKLLSAIAPTIAHPKGEPAYFSPWKDQARLIGQALGRADQMEEIIDDVAQQFADAAKTYPEFVGKKVVFLQNAIYDGEAIAYQEGLSTAFLTDLGFDIPSEIDPFQDGEGQAFIPLEQLSVLDAADVLLWATESPSDRGELEKYPVYMNLEEVKAGRLVFTDDLTAGALYFTSPLSLPFVLEQIVPALASTLAGDGPATIDAK